MIGFLSGFLEVQIDGEEEVVPWKGFNDPQGSDLPSQGIDFNLPTSIHSSEIIFPSVLDSIFSNQGTHSIGSLFVLFQFIFIHLSKITDEMRSQIPIIIGSPGSDIHDESWEINPIGFEEGQLIPIDIGFYLHRFEGRTSFLGFYFLLNLVLSHI